MLSKEGEGSTRVLYLRGRVGTTTFTLKTLLDILNSTAADYRPTILKLETELLS
jgi:hypothetical protein